MNLNFLDHFALPTHFKFIVETNQKYPLSLNIKTLGIRIIKSFR